MGIVIKFPARERGLRPGRTVAQAIFDDRPLPVLPGGVEIPLADGSHRVTVTLGQG